MTGSAEPGTLPRGEWLTALWVTAPDGQQIPLIDGGAFDWLAKVASNRRAVFVATGARAQLIAIRFRA